MTKLNFYKVNWLKSGIKLQENQNLDSIKGYIGEIHNQRPFWKRR